jgi:Icc-related predicted phosphoesterase
MGGCYCIPGGNLSNRRNVRGHDSPLVVCLADTHRLHHAVQVPDGDVLIHAGDICPIGQSVQTLIDFNSWLRKLPHRVKIYVPGNHDLPLEADPATQKLLTNARLLMNDGIEFQSLRFWGSPVTALGGAFGMGCLPDRRRLFSRIPANTDVPMTHAAPPGILDCAPGGGDHEGDPELLAAIQRLDISIHMFGHHHQGYGVDSRQSTMFVNAALLGDDASIE